MSNAQIIIDGERKAEISTETLKIKDGESIIIKITSGVYPYEKLMHMCKRFGQSFPNNKIIIIPTNVDFEEYPKEVNLDSCIEYVKDVIKDETKPYLEIYEHIYKILNNYKKIIDLNDEVRGYPTDMSAKGALIVKNVVDNSKKVIFINHPSVSIETSGMYGDSEITMKGYNGLKDVIFLNT